MELKKHIVKMFLFPKGRKASCYGIFSKRKRTKVAVQLYHNFRSYLVEMMGEFIAVASLLWRNVETVLWTVSLSPLTVLSTVFAPIPGSTPPFTFLYKKEQMLFFSYICSLVEMRGVEPLSKGHLPRLSTSVVNVLEFPSHYAH